MPMSSDTLVLGTRGSALALWQAHFVEERLARRGIPVSIREIQTTGDRITDVPLAKIGDKALFTRELDAALVDGRIDLAVHSLKDLPSMLPEGIAIAAVPERASPWDAFVAHPEFEGGLSALPTGAVVATSSLRRKAQLLAWRPDLEVVPVRGNVDTRLEKLDRSDWHGMVLACAGLERLDAADRIREEISTDIMLPAVSQGALGVVCRTNDGDTRGMLREVLQDDASARITRCERAFLARLEGGCQVPIGAHARLDGDSLVLVGCVASLDGSMMVRDSAEDSAENPEQLGTDLAESLLDRGAGEILRAVERNS